MLERSCKCYPVLFSMSIVTEVSGQSSHSDYWIWPGLEGTHGFSLKKGLFWLSVSDGNKQQQAAVMGLNLTPSNYSDLLPSLLHCSGFSILHHQTRTANQNSKLDGASRIYATDLFCSEKPSCPVWHSGTENSWFQPLSQNTPTTQPVTLQRLQGKGQKNRMPWSSLPKLHSG